LKHYPVTVKVIHNGADIKQLSPPKIKVNIPPRLIFAGRFVPQKNPLVIIQTLSRLKDLDWHCSLLGDGPMLEDVKREIEKAGMSERFHLPGWVTPEIVLEHFLQSDILFMPSLSEGLPVVGVQALATGLAIVASDIGGFLDLVDNQRNGFLVDAHDVPAFSNALRGIISNPETLLRFRQASVEKSRQFDLQKIVEQYQSILHDALDGK
jgi:glycosyltransferase involved in cell wall biosynthesis